jgi:hypothetical protein
MEMPEALPTAQIRRAQPGEAQLLSALALEAKQYWGCAP